jgi:hypothetical protein
MKVPKIKFLNRIGSCWYAMLFRGNGSSDMVNWTKSPNGMGVKHKNDFWVNEHEIFSLFLDNFVVFIILFIVLLITQ